MFKRIAPRRTILPVVLFVGLVFLIVDKFIMPRGNSGLPGPRTLCRNNLKLLGMALRHYHDDFGSFPPAYVVDDHGERAHSWRALLLPYLDEPVPFGGYNFEVPWNAPQNTTCGSVAPARFVCPADVLGKRLASATSYVAVIGLGTPWPGTAARARTDILKSPSEVIHIIEVADVAINWLKPLDLRIDEIEPHINSRSRLAISSRHAGGVNALFVDGNVRFIEVRLSASDVRALLSDDDHDR